MESLWLSVLLPVYFFCSHSNESSYLLPLLLPLDFTQINTHLSNHKLRVFQPQLSLQNCLESFFFSLSNSHLNFHNIYTKTLFWILMYFQYHHINRSLIHRESQDYQVKYPLTLYSLFWILLLWDSSSSDLDAEVLSLIYKGSCSTHALGTIFC